MEVVRHGRPVARYPPPPPAPGQGLRRWEQMPLANRQRLLGLLSQLLERQWRQHGAHGAPEGGDADVVRS